MSVVGIDIGFQSCFVAVARHGGVETIANEYSDRRSPSVVGFGRTRAMGISAQNQAMSNYKNTVRSFKLLVGRRFSDPVVQEEIKSLPFCVEELSKDKIGIKIKLRDEECVFSPEQIMTMMLTYLKQVASKALGRAVADCVVSVPSFFTDAQRRAMLDACSVAGLNCLRLMNETTAVALAYGIYKQDLPAEGESARNVVFVDMGHHALQVTVCAFNKGKLKVLSKAFDPTLGGRNFDQRLLKHFAAEFKTKYKIDVLSHPRATLRLITECEKLKKLMSANATSIPMNIECLMDDKDVSGRMKREDFQDLCKDLFDRVKIPLQQALDRSGLSANNIHSVEIIGGATRIPAVKEAITSLFHREISTTLNLDEAVARGCALQCAMLSPTFKVRDFSIADTQPFPIKLCWSTTGEDDRGEMDIFSENDPIFHTKMLTFHRREPFDLEANYKFPKLLPTSDPFIGRFHISDVKPNEEDESSKVKVKVRMNIHGIFRIKSATMVEKKMRAEAMETEPSVEQQTGAAVDDTKKGEGDTAAEQPDQQQQQPDQQQKPDQQQQTDQQQPEGGDQQPDSTPAPQQGGEKENGENEVEQQAENMDSQPSSTSEADSQQAEKPEQPAEAKKPASKKPKKVYNYVDLPINEQTHSLSKQEIDNAFEKEVNMIQADRLETERADAKNSLEEYVYDMRDKLSTSLEQYMPEADRVKFLEQLSSTEDWLYDEGEDQSKKVYVARLDELKKVGNPVEDRLTESANRPAAFDMLGKALVHFEKILTAYDSGDELYNHIDSADMDKVRAATLEKRTWLNTKLQAQSLLAPCVDPAVRCSHVVAEKNALESTCKPIVTKPKPKVEPPKDEGPKEGEGDKMEEGEEQGKQNDEQEDKQNDKEEQSKEKAEDMDVD